jgi:putative spermidine/putrescine transport system permease protein
MRGWRARSIGVFCAIVAFFLVLPSLIVIPASFSDQATLSFPPQGFTFDWYLRFFSEETWTEATGNSLRIAGLSAAMATVLGTMIAFSLARQRVWGRRVLLGLTLAPLIVPLVILAIGVYNLFLRWHLVGTTLGFVLAHVVLGIPLVVLMVAAVLRRLDPSFEQAAMTLGAGRFDTFRLVTFPIVLPGVAIGAFLAFLASFDEVVIAVFLTSPQLKTLPVKMWESMRVEVDLTVAAVGTVLTVVASFLVLGSLLVRERRTRV